MGVRGGVCSVWLFNLALVLAETMVSMEIYTPGRVGDNILHIVVHISVDTEYRVTAG